MKIYSNPKFAIEIKDQPKKALEGIAVFLYYFN